MSYFFDPGKTWVTDDNPLPVQTPQLTDENDAVRANMYVYTDGEWVPRRWPNATAPHQNASLANNATTNIVTSSQGGGGAFRIHELQLFSTVAGVYSLYDGTPSGTTNLLARIGIAANTAVTKDFKGLIQVTGTNHLVLRNDTGNTASVTTQTDIEVIS